VSFFFGFCFSSRRRQLARPPARSALLTKQRQTNNHQKTKQNTTAENLILQSQGNKEYLPIEGLDAFRRATVKLLLGEGHPAVSQGRVATLQALSGTGSLRVGAAFIAKFLPKGTVVYLSNPTWGNHRNIFADEGVEWRNYRYFDAEAVDLDWTGMQEDLEAAPEGSVVVLHGEVAWID
jgi:aspartate aminotransferase, chloroplastic